MKQSKGFFPNSAMPFIALDRRTGLILITASVGLVLVGLCAVVLRAQPGQRIERQEGAQVSVEPQGDAPVELQITHPESVLVDRYLPELEVVITNTSNKVVSAYAIRYDVGLNGQLRAGGVDFARPVAARSLLGPGDSQRANIGGTRYSSPIERLVVSIDFLEFTDGTTWGADTYSSREVLAGLRAGEKATAKYLLRLLTERGPTAITKELQSADAGSIPLAESPKWREGFQRGVEFFRARVKHEVRDFSVMELERVLTGPIDGLDEIKGRVR